jgi:uncharacterized repeat protein (TIGR01451 family)
VRTVIARPLSTGPVPPPYGPSAEPVDSPFRLLERERIRSDARIVKENTMRSHSLTGAFLIVALASAALGGCATTTHPSWPTMLSSESVEWTSLAYPTGAASSSVLGIEKGMPREVRTGRTFEYKIIVSNLTDNELKDVVLTDQLGENLRLTGSTPQGRLGSEGVVTWDIGSLGPNESKRIRVSATAAEAGTVGSCTSATYTSTLCSTARVESP